MFRAGQWVKFNADIEQAHRSKDGKCVGIYRKGHFTSTRIYEPEAIIPVNAKGENIAIIVNGNMVNMTLPSILPGLEPVTNRDDIPQERLQHTPGHWKPRP